MVVGMSLRAFTLLHVWLSLAGIASGLVVLCGLLTSRRLESWTAVFLTTTALTSITGFLFPFRGITPGIVVGILSVMALGIAIVARYPMRLAWRKTYVISACLALYFNCFVLVVQSFQKIPVLKALAPTQHEPPFAIVQVIVLVFFVVCTVFATRRFLAEPSSSAARAASV